MVKSGPANATHRLQRRCAESVKYDGCHLATPRTCGQLAKAKSVVVKFKSKAIILNNDYALRDANDKVIIQEVCIDSSNRSWTRESNSSVNSSSSGISAAMASVVMGYCFPLKNNFGQLI